MKRILFVLLLTAGLAQASQAQKTLFNFGKNAASLDEFTRQFYKNNPVGSITKDTARYYLNLFVNFKLKVQQAKDLGMDTASDFVSEMGQYKKQLAQPYMVDTSATEMLIDEAYQHSTQEVKVSHIMVAIGYDALPKDTLEAYNKALDLKKKLKSESFDSVAAKYSEDPSAANNFGHLGYFTAFDMIYPFEKAAFNTKVGEIAGPIRTQFGYHIIKVWDKRAWRGKMHIAHILIRVEEGAKDDDILRGKQKVDSISAEIKAGKATFDEMVAQYSEDFSNKDKDGEIGWLESTNRNFPENFREAVFALKNDGDITPAIKTPIGWHLIKRLGYQSVQPKDSNYADLKRKISNPKDERFALTKQAVISRIKKEYGFTEEANALAEFIKTDADSTILYGTWKAENHTNLKGKLFVIGSKSYSKDQFSNFIEINQQTALNQDLGMVVKNLYNSFVEQQVWEYEENNLVNKYDKYRYLVQEYNDGILLFNLSEKRVWNKGITDTTGLKEFYEANKTRYMWNDRVQAHIYECQTEDICKKVNKWVKKGKADTTISRMAHDIHPLSLAIKTGKFEKNDHPVLANIKWKKGRQQVELDGKHYIVLINEVLPAQPKALSEVRGPITSEYQNVLEKQWIEELKSTYPVTINQDTFDAFLSTLPR